LKLPQIIVASLMNVPPITVVPLVNALQIQLL
jgi:hypothetical protein